MQGRISFSNLFRRGSAPPKPESPRSTPVKPDDPLRGSVPSMEYKQSTLLSSSGSPHLSRSGLKAGDMQHANGSFSHAQSESHAGHLGSADAVQQSGVESTAAASSEASLSSASKPEADEFGPRSALKRFFTRPRQQPSHELRHLPDKPANGSRGADNISSSVPALAAASNRKEVRFSPGTKPDKSDSATVPDRVSLHGRERRSDVGSHASQAWYVISDHHL